MPDMKDSSIYRARLERCQKLMLEKNIDVLFLAPGPNMYYLSGFLEEPGERLLALIVSKFGELLFIVPELYQEQVKSCSWIENIISWKDSESPKVGLSTAMNQIPMRRKAIGVDSRMWSRFLIMLLEVAPDAKFEDAASVMNGLRIGKTRQETELLEKSAQIADAAFVEVVKECTQGARENEVAAKIVYELRRFGGRWDRLRARRVFWAECGSSSLQIRRKNTTERRSGGSRFRMPLQRLQFGHHTNSRDRQLRC